MTLDATSSNEGALTIEQATSLLSGSADAPAAAVEPEEPEQAAAEQDDASPPEADTAGEAEEPGDGGESETQEPEPEASGVDAPTWWAAEHKAAFAKLPPDLQAVVSQQEETRERVVAKAKEEAATARKSAETEAETYRSTLQAIGSWLPKAVETFKSRWDGITAEDWAAFAEQNPEAYTKAKAQYELETKQIADAQKAHDDAQKVQRAAALKAESEKLPQYAPALVDPKEGPARKRELAKFLVESGVDAAMLPDLTAVALGLAYDAMLYRQGKAKLAATPKPTPAVPKAPVAPTAPQGRTSQQRSLEQIGARLNKSGSIEDAVALLQARRK